MNTNQNNKFNITKPNNMPFQGMLMAILVAMLLGVFTHESKGQIETMYSLYRFNPQIITPAHVGSSDVSDITVINRRQWTGFEGSPTTFAASLNSKWGENKGLGVVALMDQAGPIKTTAISADFAYHVPLSDKWTMSGGIRGGFSNLTIQWSAIRLTHGGDDNFQEDISSGLKFNTGWGLRFSKGDGLFLSLSQPRVLKYDFGAASGGYKDVDYLYTMVGTKVRLGSQITLYPSALVRIATDVPLSYDLNVNSHIHDKFDLGFSYRKGDSYGIRLGFQATKNLYAGYVYELPISAISKVTTQTHEIALRFTFNKKNSLETK
ncbi:PorP/SprF family type IX secretion system membrane protein [Aquirufa aurantiipilula]|uniref:PorP/SprF family type IX secretion system membrane protein n=1 Tax=Aquirufa aurantiipilula TaxID=2696561 RepID=UPI001CAA71D7|nr:PorP/SprF family type IX secretion system membrane protein [Aquirufa aurantiipilula]MBZ1325686.1 type IX secretion system membrane protein PorP/SprF [Aquirufa aurantiipilula]